MALVAEKAGFEVVPGWTWWDERESKPREIDVVASRHFIQDRRGHTLIVHVLAECKANKPGMVIFESALDQHFQTHSANLYMAHSWGQPSALKRTVGDVSGSEFANAFGWATRAWGPTETVGTQFGLLRERKGSEKPKAWEVVQDEAYAYVDGLMHALLAFKREKGQIMQPPGAVPVAYMNLAALVLVIDGPLYRYQSNPARGRRALTRIKAGTIYRTGRLRDRRYAFRIDVMSRAAFGSLLSTLQTDGSAMAAELLNVDENVIVESVNSFGNSQ